MAQLTIDTDQLEEVADVLFVINPFVPKRFATKKFFLNHMAADAIRHVDGDCDWTSTLGYVLTFFRDDENVCCSAFVSSDTVLAYLRDKGLAQ